MPIHPYRGLPADQFWSTGVQPVAAGTVDPMRPARFTIARGDAVAAAGSWFAQMLPRHLLQAGFRFLQTEAAQAGEPAASARFGTISSARHLHQLLLGAYGLHRPLMRAWRRTDGKFIDPLRPQMFPQGFASAEAVIQERRRHLEAVRRMAEECAVFAFTLGSTEAWLAEDGTVLPVPPGALDVDLPGPGARFVNFSVAEMREDMALFLADLAAVNARARVILTVSPVPLVATFEPRHVMVSNAVSKAALLVAADEIVRAHDNVVYFPAYEIVTAPQGRGAYWEADWRTVTQVGMAHVMRVFTTNMMQGEGAAAVGLAE